MDKDFGICARDKEIKQIFTFVKSHVDQNKPGILYLTGPPGTGKTMSVNQVLDRIEDIPRLNLNCYKAQTSKLVLMTLCDFVKLHKHSKLSEPEMLAQLEKKFSSRTSKPHLVVLDEMDQLPQSKNVCIFKKLFSWAMQKMSKLIIIGIANTVNMTARSQTLSRYLGNSFEDIERIIFKPYNSKDIKSILGWYLANDENFEGASVDQKALDVISMKFARENGDIRGAIDALRLVIDDTRREEHETMTKVDQFPTPPSTPPASPCKERTTTLASAANSVRKRQRVSHYFDDKTTSIDKIVLVCLHKFAKDGSIDRKSFIGKTADVLHKYNTISGSIFIKAALQQLELQGLLTFKKGVGRSSMAPVKIILNASESEISKLVPEHESIERFVDTA